MRSLNESRFTYYDFFAGAGLVDLALAPRWECIWANDIDPKKAEVYSRNFGQDHFVLGDVAEVSPESLPRPADMAWASFPCQDLSLAGWQRGMSADRSGTFWAFWRIMAKLEEDTQLPHAIVIENVQGVLYRENLSGLCEALAALGLQFGAVLIDARHFVPQSRPRVFVVAVHRSVDALRLHTDEPPDTVWHPKSVTNAFGDLKHDLRALWRWWRLPQPTGRVPPADDLIDDEAAGAPWHTRAETRRLLELMDDKNWQKVRDALSSGERHVGFLYKRMRNGRQRAEVRFDGVAGCLRVPMGGSSRQTVLIVSDGEVCSRLLSPREAARLMGAPDIWLPDHYNQAYKAMGDGVAVPVVRHLADHLLDALVLAARGGRRQLPLRRSAGLTRFRRASTARAAAWDQQQDARGRG